MSRFDDSSTSRPLSEDEIRTFPERTISASRRHLVLSMVSCGVVLALELAWGASLGVLTLVAGIGVLLIAYDIVRIRGARAAQASPEAARAFVRQQQRSHLIRGRVTLVLIPVVLALTWVPIAASESPIGTSIWVVLVAVTAFLLWGWLWWYRALRTIRRWTTD